MIGGNMKNIIPFKKDIIFKTKLEEITSISLENTLKMIDGVIEGNFIIDGEYKENDNSDSEPFNLEIPFKSVMDERFKTDKAIIDIDDFYYEITKDNTLTISIDVLVDKLEEKPLIKLDDIFDEDKIEKKKDNVKAEIREDSEEINENNNTLVKDKITTIFNTDNSDDPYVTYNVYILRNNDNVDTILDKYKITKEELEKYNDLSDLKVGDKLLIPNERE